MFKLFGSIEPGKSNYFWFANKYREHFIQEVFRTFDSIEFWVSPGHGSQSVKEWMTIRELTFLGPVKPYDWS